MVTIIVCDQIGQEMEGSCGCGRRRLLNEGEGQMLYRVLMEVQR